MSYDMPDDPIPLTPAERQAIKRLCEEATPGPWIIRRCNGIASVWTPKPHIKLASISAPQDTGLGKSSVQEVNTALIAASRSALPALLDALERVETENARLRESLEKTAVLETWDGAIGFQCFLCHAVSDTHWTMQHAPTCPLAPQASDGEEENEENAE